MQKLMILTLLATILTVSASATAEDLIVYTAHQDFDSRIYLLRMDGTVVDYFEYSFYRFVDVEVVNNELYVAEAFAPRAYKVDLETGELQTIIDDWSLYYFYDLAFDGTYLYATEWDMNRYDIDGHRDSSTGFDGDVFGSTWDGSYLWTLDDTNIVKCWNISDWPTINEVPALNFVPPTPECRGLCFDGEYFWSADAKETLGGIYRFDHSGQIIDQWPEPAFIGWAAGMITDDSAGLEEGAQTNPIFLRLEPNDPNPFTGSTTIAFSLPGRAQVDLQIFNLEGRSIATLVSEPLSPGRHTVIFDSGRLLSSGVYFYRLQADDTTLTRKMVLIRD